MSNTASDSALKPTSLTVIVQSDMEYSDSQKLVVFCLCILCI